MTIAPKRMTLEDYLTYDDRSEKHYELVAGVLVEMPPESQRNVLIGLFLLAQFLKSVPLRKLSNKTEIAVGGSRATMRLPDLVILTDELADLMQNQRRSTITLDMPPPLFVVEVVSPGKTNEDRDYRYKRSEYAARGIAEYWIVDPMREQVTVLTLVDGLYEEQVFRGDEKILSPNFSTWELTAAQVLQAGAALNPG